jgi:hypothetical protein
MEVACETEQGNYGCEFVQDEKRGYVCDWCVGERRGIFVQKFGKAAVEALNS